ncbi:MAG: hypothetical protein A2W85_06730 [Bacteroidetes bacterium GWF2_41_31]|nr:MAG: hypothetical protein A2W85_06730 [Bacteroidetes bacterium GWF2_41_31]
MMGYFLFLKVKSSILDLKNPLKLFLFLMLTLTAVLYGWLLALFSQQVLMGDVGELTINLLFNYILLFIFIITLLRMIFPTYKPQQALFPLSYPLSRWQGYLFSVFNGFFTPYFFYLVMFLVSGSVFLGEYNIVFLVSGLLVLVSSHLFRRLIQYFIDFRLKKKAFLVLAAVAILVTCLYFLSFTLVDFGSWQGLVIIALLLTSGYCLDINQFEPKRHETAGDSRKSSRVYLKLITNNPKVRIPLLVAMVLKIIFFGIDLFLMETKAGHLMNGELFYWIVASPMIIFTYVYNNTWGFWKAIWMNMEVRTGDAKQLLWQHFRLMALALVVDLCITLPLLYISWGEAGFILTFYFTSAFFLIAMSFIWSIFTPRQINATFQMKGSTSPVSVLVSMAGVLLLTTLRVNNWFYLIVPLYVIFGGMAIWVALNYYEDGKVILMRKLRKAT